MDGEGCMIRAWWSRGPKPGNLGDMLTPVVLEGLGHRVKWTPRAGAELLAIGSVVRFAEAGQTVWGSGAMWVNDRPSPKARYLAVRGPLTRDAVLRAGGECPEVYGDPALLLPLVHNTPVEPVHDLGVVPHYVDPAPEGDWAVISPLSGDPLSVVDQIRQCRAIVSSSLHGIIVAHAYGIPAAWVRLGNRLDGDDTKFRDYAASVGVELEPYSTVEAARPVLPQPFDTGPLRVALA
jgi:hypothetical protein